MLSEQGFFRFVEEKIDELTGYADAQAEVGNSRKDLDELLNGYPYCLDEVTYKAYVLMAENLPKPSDVDFHDLILLWDQGFKSLIQKQARNFHNAGIELTPLQAILCSSALLQEK